MGADLRPMDLNPYPVVIMKRAGGVPSPMIQPPMTPGRFKALIFRAQRRHDAVGMWRLWEEHSKPGFYQPQATKTERSYYRVPTC